MWMIKEDQLEAESKSLEIEGKSATEDLNGKNLKLNFKFHIIYFKCKEKYHYKNKYFTLNNYLTLLKHWNRQSSSPQFRSHKYPEGINHGRRMADLRRVSTKEGEGNLIQI